MKFSEKDGAWHDGIPEWVDYLLTVGYAFANNANKPQKISLISMPCDSPGAGLVALGAMRYFLSGEKLSDDAIYDRLRREGDKTLYSREDMFKYVGEENGKAVVEEKDKKDNRYSKKQKKELVTRIALLKNLDLRFENESIIVSSDKALQHLQIYENIIDKGRLINQETFSQSDSGVCLAGKRKGLSCTKELLNKISFEQDGDVANLYNLLSLLDDSLDVVSRVTLYNTRTARMDRAGSPPKIVIADGIDAFLKIIDLIKMKKMPEANIVAVIDRTEKREKLESLQIKISNLLDYYEPYSSEMLPPPMGMAVVTYKKRI